MTKRTSILIGFIVIKFLLQYFMLSPEYDLHRDEFLHLDQGNHLAWGFTSVPPVTSWLSLLIRILGNSVFWIKFFPALFGALTLLVVWKTVEELKGNLFALILSAAAILVSVLLRLNSLYQPNSLDVLCWTMFYYVVVRYFNNGNRRLLYLAAIVFAIGFLNKYNIIFMLAGIVPSILLTRQRNVFSQKSIYLATLCGILLVGPNLFWQYQNNFPVVHHMKELAATQLVHVDRVAFINSQLFFFIGSLFVIIAALWALIMYQPYQRYKPFFFSFFITLMIFLSLKAKDYYAIGVYPIYIAFGAAYLGAQLNTGWTRYLKLVAIIIPLLFLIPMYYIDFPKSPQYIVKNEKRYKDLGMLRWEDGKEHPLPQDYADMLGWKELAQKVDQVYANLPNRAQTIVLCDNYGQAGAINYYSKKGVKAVSFNADYINWFNFDQQYVNVIRVKTLSGQAGELQESAPYFTTSLKIAEVSNPFAREYGTTIFLFTGAKVNVNKRLKAEITESKF